MKTIIISILAVALICLGVSFGAAWYNVKEDLEAANRVILDEANFSQGLRKTIEELRQQDTERDAELAKAWGALDQMQAKLDRGVVIGQVLVDGNRNGAMDAWDYRLENGLKMVVNRFNEPTRSYIWVGEVEVLNGEYRIDLPEGIYAIGVIHTYSGIYGLRYNPIFIANTGDTIVKKGEVSLGPTILLCQKYVSEKG